MFWSDTGFGQEYLENWYLLVEEKTPKMFGLGGFVHHKCPYLSSVVIARMQSGSTADSASARFGCETGSSPPRQVHDRFGEVVQ